MYSASGLFDPLFTLTAKKPSCQWCDELIVTCWFSGRVRP